MENAETQKRKARRGCSFKHTKRCVPFPTIGAHVPTVGRDVPNDVPEIESVCKDL
jgi:hypothetical protein